MPSVGERRPAPAPITQVRNLDRPTDKPLLICLPPRDAVVWAYASAIGERVGWERFQSVRRRFAQGWQCGSYWADEASDAAQ